MQKTLRTHLNISAKTTLTLATCIFAALTLTTRADDKDKQENPALQAPAKGGAAELQPSPSTPSVNSSLDKDKAGQSSSTSTSSDKSSQGSPGSGSSSTSGKLSRGDEKFIKDAAKGGLMEVHMGKMGVQQAQNPAVKQFAQRLIDDHTKANNELKQLAAQKGITLPDEKVASSSTDSERTKVRESESSDTHSASMTKLHNLSGTEFDREYVQVAVKEHEKDVKEFERAAQKAEDADIKAWAQKTAPTLREHLQQAKSLQAQVGGTTGGSGDTSSSSQK